MQPHPVADQLRRAAGFRPGDTPERRLDRLKALLDLEGAAPDTLAVLAALLSVPAGDRCPPLDLDPQALKARTLEALLGQLVRLTARRPVLMVVEDAHWADPTSLEYLGQILERLAELRLLLIVTCRPDGCPPWIGRPHVHLLPLRRLGRDVGRAFQIQDDLLDLTSDSPRWGKTIGGDLIEGKKTYLLLRALERSEGDDAQWFGRIVANDGLPAEQVPEARRRMARLGVLEEAAAAVSRYTDGAHEQLAALPNGPQRATLRALLHQMSRRVH